MRCDQSVSVTIANARVTVISRSIGSPVSTLEAYQHADGSALAGIERRVATAGDELEQCLGERASVLAVLHKRPHVLHRLLLHLGVGAADLADERIGVLGVGGALHVKRR